MARGAGATIRVIDSAESTADAAAGLWRATSGETGGGQPAPQIRCFATDSVEKFQRLGSKFLGRPVGVVQLIDLGG